MPNCRPDLAANAAFERCGDKPGPRVRGAASRISAISLLAGLTWCAGLQAASAQDDQDEIPFKFTNIHLETNASACDMGIQMLFDTEGITSGKVKDPDGHVIYDVRTKRGFEENGGLTESFLEGVEPPIVELETALGCDPDPDAVSLEELQDRHPAGVYEFEGKSSEGEEFDGSAELSYHVPAGPFIVQPLDGDDTIDPDSALEIDWNGVADPIIPALGPVQIVGYHVVVKDVTDQVIGPLAMGPLPPHQFDVDVPASQTAVELPAAYLEPNRIYEFEVLATEAGGNQTITEGGAFCTAGADPIEPCEVP